MHLFYKLFMGICGSLCSLMMTVVGELAVAGVLAVCVLIVLLDVPERTGHRLNGGRRG